MLWMCIKCALQETELWSNDKKGLFQSHPGPRERFKCVLGCYSLLLSTSAVFIPPFKDPGQIEGPLIKH